MDLVIFKNKLFNFYGKNSEISNFEIVSGKNQKRKKWGLIMGGKGAIKERGVRPLMAKVLNFVLFSNLSPQMLMMIQMSLSADPDIEGQ